jgi:hypothetical protein
VTKKQSSEYETLVRRIRERIPISENFETDQKISAPACGYVYKAAANKVARWFVFKQKIQNLGRFWRVLQ